MEVLSIKTLPDNGNTIKIIKKLLKNNMIKRMLLKRTLQKLGSTILDIITIKRKITEIRTIETVIKNQNLSSMESLKAKVF